MHWNAMAGNGCRKFELLTQQFLVGPKKTTMDRSQDISRSDQASPNVGQKVQLLSSLSRSQRRALSNSG
jgi:hypothetical protein